MWRRLEWNFTEADRFTYKIYALLVFEVHWWHISQKVTYRVSSSKFCNHFKEMWHNEGSQTLAAFSPRWLREYTYNLHNILQRSTLDLYLPQLLQKPQLICKKETKWQRKTVYKLYTISEERTLIKPTLIVVIYANW